MSSCRCPGLVLYEFNQPSPCGRLNHLISRPDDFQEIVRRLAEKQLEVEDQWKLE
jgi:hypothetical protein